MTVNEDTFGRRYERKFIVPLSRVRELIFDGADEYTDMFEFDYLQNNVYYNIIENVYLDDSKLSSYHDHLERKNPRTKIRLRRYSPDGLPTDSIYFEIKSKKDSETFKSRIRLKSAWVRPFINEGTISHTDVLALNDELKEKKVLETLEQLHHYIHRKHYVPMLKSTYMRHALKLRESKKVRVTLDRDIRFIRLNFSVPPRIPYREALNENDVIVEVKISDPKYMNLVDRFQGFLGESVSISKYCLGAHSTQDKFLLSNKEKTMSVLRKLE